MFALHLDFLTRIYRASAFNDRGQGEWPPHPTRVFSALVDALHADAPTEGPDAAEAHALDVLAKAGAPDLYATGAHDRDVPLVFVPVNDKTNGAEHDKQSRTFPVKLPFEPRVTYAWPEVPAGLDVQALERVCSRVARLGHSASFVHLHTETDATAPGAPWEHWTPDARFGTQILRTPLPEQREASEALYARIGDYAPGHVLPSDFTPYGLQAPQPIRSTRAGGLWISFTFEAGVRLPLTQAAALCHAVRGALMKHAAQPPHPMLSGHAPEGIPLRTEHVSVLPLSFVESPHADGLLRGFAVVLPASADRSAQHALKVAIGQWERDRADGRLEVGFGRRQVFASRILDEGLEIRTLQRGRWASPSATWASVTPVALDGSCDRLDFTSEALRDPLQRAQLTPEQLQATATFDAGKRRKALKTATKLLRRSLAQVLELRGGEPVSDDWLQAVQIEVSLTPFVHAVPFAGAFPPFYRASKSQNRLVHARFIFPDPLQGPLMLGAGRHTGLGFCVPIDA